jgi:hypothetical protein
MDKDHPDYYLATTATIMVPVQVRYHLPTGVVYSFECPTREQVEQAIKDAENMKHNHIGVPNKITCQHPPCQMAGKCCYEKSKP